MFPVVRHQQYLVPESEISGRIKRFTGMMKEADLTVCWIDHPVDRLYFTGTSQDGVLMVSATGESIFFAKKSFQRARAESPREVKSFPGRRGLLDKAKEFAGVDGSIGLSLDVTPGATYLWLTDKLPGCRIIDISLMLRTVKSVKSEWEVAQIREAGKTAEQIFSRMNRYVKAGQSELELSGEIERDLRAMGHPGVLRIRRPSLALACICAVTGEAGLYPTNFDGPVGGEGPFPSSPAGAGWKRVEENELLMLDMVTVHNGYHADNARTFFSGPGKACEAALKAHETCRGAMEMIASGMKPGADCTALFAETQEWVEARGEPEGFMGYEENRVKFFGHGVGLELDEFPVITAKLPMTLQAGMVIAVEPKAFLKGVGPVGVENTYLVTETGCESLCTTESGIITL